MPVKCFKNIYTGQDIQIAIKLSRLPEYLAKVKVLAKSLMSVISVHSRHSFMGVQICCPLLQFRQILLEIFQVTYPWPLGNLLLPGEVAQEEGVFCGEAADGMAAGSQYSVVRVLSSILCSTLCALDALLMSMNATVHAILFSFVSSLPPAVVPAPVGVGGFPFDNNLTLCTRPYLEIKTNVLKFCRSLKLIKNKRFVQVCFRLI